MNDNFYKNESIKENEEFTKNIYFDKACNYLNISTKMLIVVFIFFIINIIGSNSSNGFILYILANIIAILCAFFVFKTKDAVEHHNIKKSKVCIIWAEILAFMTTLFHAFFCIINPQIIDLVILSSIGSKSGSESITAATYMSDFDTAIFSFNIIGATLTCIVITLFIYRAINSILKASGTVETKDFAKNFYDKL